MLTDVENWKNWDTELRQATIFGDFALNTKGELVPKKGPKLQFRISEHIPSESYTFITKMPVGSLMIRRTLNERKGAIEFTDDIQFTGFLKTLFGLFLGRGFKKVLPEVMYNFKRLAEQD